MNYLARSTGPHICLLQASKDHLSAGYHRKRVGLNHLAFRATSPQQVDELRAWLKASGYPLLYDERYPYATAPGYYACFVKTQTAPGARW